MIMSSTIFDLELFFIGSVFCDLFIFFYQVALSGTQIWWTTEVNIAFARLEEGYENALKDYFKKQVSILTQ